MKQQKPTSSVHCFSPISQVRAGAASAAQGISGCCLLLTLMALVALVTRAARQAVAAVAHGAWLVGLVTLMLWFCSPRLHAEASVDFQLQVYEDTSTTRSAAEVLQALQNNQFQPLPGQHFSAGYTRSVFWLWWEPKSPWPANTGQIYLNLDYPLMQSAVLYAVSQPTATAAAQVQRLGQTGSSLPAAQRSVFSTSHYFALTPADPKLRGYLIKMESKTSLSVPLRLVSEREFIADQRNSHLWYGFIIGTLALLMLYNLFVSWWMKEPANALYLLFLAGLLFVFVAVSGIASTYISAKLGGPLLWLLPFTLHLISISSYLFAKQFFDNALLPKVFLKILTVGAVFSAALMLTVALDYQVAMMVAMLNALCMVFLLFLLAGAAFYYKIPGAPLFLLGKLFVLAGGFIQFAKTVALIPATGLTEYILFLGVILEAIVLSGGLALKTKILQQEQSITRAQLLAVQQSSLQEMTELNQVLAKEVLEKTHSETIQKALFTINELAAGNEDMHTFLQHVHQTVSGLMFARNFYVALYHPQQQSVQFAYFADEMDTDLPQPTEFIPAQRLSGSWTMWVIEHGESLFGNCRDIEQKTGLPPTFGSIAKCWLGMPLRDEQGVFGVLVVQIYHDQPSYTSQERKVLDYVSQHISSAVQRKQYRSQLEMQVQERTQALTESLSSLKTMHQQLSAINSENQAHLQQVQTLLDNTGQGFLTCDQALEIHANFSKECLQIFQTTALNGSLADLLAQQQPALRALFVDVLTEVLQPEQSPVMVTTFLSLLPAQLTIHDRLYQTEYKRLAVDTLMVILSDITEKTKLASALQQQQEQANFIVYALNQPDEVRQVLLSFQHFLQTATSAEQPPCTPTVLTELYRQIHTFKSLLAQIRCPALPATLHQVEDSLQTVLESPPPQLSVHEQIDFAGLDSQLQQALQLLERQLPAHLFAQDPHLPLPRRLQQDVVNFLQNHNVELAQQLRAVQFQSFSSLLRPHFEMAQMLAQSQGKLLAAIRFHGEDLRVDAEVYQSFFQVLVHLFRNAIDHGIEAPAQRIANGKPAAASIQCQLQRDEHRLQLTISDDGRGIAIEQVRQKALALHLLDPEDSAQLPAEQIAQLIFADALSTKQEVNLLSGRGIGLAAVKQQLTQFDASIEVQSTPGAGCTFRIVLPIRTESMALNAAEC